MARDPVLDAAVRRATDAVQKTAESPTNAMSVTAVSAAKPELRAAIEAAVAPVIQNVTGTEPHFWMRRSFWSQVGSGLGAVAAIAVPVVDYLQTHTTESGTLSVSAFGLAMCIWSNYSAYRSRKAVTPLGTPVNPVAYRG